MASFRVVLSAKDGRYRVQKKCGFIFTSWRFLNPVGHVIQFDENGTFAAAFSTKEEAVALMERAADPPTGGSENKVVSWIGDKE